MGIPVPLFWLRTFYVEFRWSPDEVHLESRYIEYKYANSSIFQVDSRWTPDGYWSPAGVHLNSVGECKVLGIHVEDSTWIPCGNSIWNGGIHMESTPFHVEYRWKKITKMGEISAKTYSMWNRGAG
jgi:hypothetical protein